MTLAASGTMQWACTSTVLTRLPAITTSQRFACACACPPEPPPAEALAPALTAGGELAAGKDDIPTHLGSSPIA